MTDHQHHVVRRMGRIFVPVPAVLVLLLAGPAFAIPPEQWPAPDPVSTLDVLVVLVLIPLALFAAITLLVLVPSMARGEKYTPGLAWRNENEWFGGPRGGVGAVDQSDGTDRKPVDGAPGAATEQGGASARW